ncbi:DNA-binding CsgD family transcriptional regulator [Breznakia sp. PF5-3]|uniref:LuxR C-terminal-related transcriptional regulator n=1 Tax=unclassified Breznakia TaxID=2623764 RepID=UPI002404FC6D|nr:MULTISPECIES: LuxR C-terminal-related transcriptional regulator [unclassified Breznakia]MDL2276889.1 LuxR C-terminal-related transcriptional regulator [Breznakia sp. OttesenSCG-928-G09]MDF9825897.1 DNA-binding CsgD family transcriptional regulator [Breznakia sp. PM6-1]MDF9835577.1 DNA-binding CsgD family transcriptional regulator [Breznakia sp. PF5-3]MDF9838970.1 DNA-binding CsgD family transcriptional regulator [Breznakia sp. PFB2-8]MDF9860988.1 DNA-binding CsgD family transcriptional regu
MKSKNTIYSSLFLIFLIVVCLWLFVFHESKSINIDNAISTQGTYDLTNVDFHKDVYELSPQWDSWENKLYSPKNISDAESPLPYNQLNYRELNYITHRINLKLEPNKLYGLSYNTSNFSMRMYIDGKEVACVGNPGTTKEATQPSIQKKVTYFTPTNTNTEIIIQVANFVYVEGGKPPIFTLGEATTMINYERNSNIKYGIIFGILIMSSIFYLSVFLLNRKQITSLLFSILCLFLSFAAGNVFELYVDEWQLSIRLEYLNYIWAAIILAYLVNRLFPNTLHKYSIYFYLLFSFLFSCLILFTEPLFFSSFLVQFQIISVIMILQGVFSLVFINKDWSFKKIFTFVGIFLFAVFIIIDILTRNNVTIVHFFAGKTFNSAIGMVLFVFCYMLVLSVEQSETSKRIERLHLSLKSAEKKYYELITRQEEIQPEDKLVKYGLSKREKEIALLLIDGKSREEIMNLLHISLGTINTHCTHIYQKANCNSVIDLICKLQKN